MKLISIYKGEYYIVYENGIDENKMINFQEKQEKNAKIKMFLIKKSLKEMEINDN